MKCRTVATQLPAYLANELPDRTRRRVDAHLKHCPLCTAELRALRRTDQLIDTLGEIEPRRDLVGLVMRHIEREQETAPAYRRVLDFLRLQRPKLQLAVANILIIAGLALTFYRFQQQHPATTPELAQSSITQSQPGLDKNQFARFTQGLKDVGQRVVLWVRQPIPADTKTKQPTFVHKLNRNELEALNTELARANGDQPVDLRGSDVLPVDVLKEPPILLSPGPDGALLIAPGPAEGNTALSE